MPRTHFSRALRDAENFGSACAVCARHYRNLSVQKTLTPEGKAFWCAASAEMGQIAEAYAACVQQCGDGANGHMARYLQANGLCEYIDVLCSGDFTRLEYF